VLDRMIDAIGVKPGEVQAGETVEWSPL
jgi:hypothetical protein